MHSRALFATTFILAAFNQETRRTTGKVTADSFVNTATDILAAGIPEFMTANGQYDS
jgi:hypothetical protein